MLLLTSSADVHAIWQTGRPFDFDDGPVPRVYLRPGEEGTRRCPVRGSGKMTQRAATQRNRAYFRRE